MIGMIFDMIGVRDECQHGDAIPVSQQIAECGIFYAIMNSCHNSLGTRTSAVGLKKKKSFLQIWLTNCFAVTPARQTTQLQYVVKENLIS